jgi:ankyrin repeat protein
LIFACRQGDLESAKLLLAAGADINQASEYGWTPVLTATQNRHYVLGKYLMDHGADVNLANKAAWTNLYLATDNRNIEGGDFPVPKPDMDGLEYIRLLLDHKADPNAQIRVNTMTRTIFTMQWLMEPGATAFLRASQSSDTALMKLLLERGANPKIVTDYGDTALTAAAGIGWVEGVTYEWSKEENLAAIRMLLDLGLDPNGANGDGRTPLMGAALKGRNDVIQLLVDRGAKLETHDKGSRDTDKLTSKLAGVTWQPLDYAEGLVRVGVQSAVLFPDTAKLIRKLMKERGLVVPAENRNVDSICVVNGLCKDPVKQ